MGMFDWFFGKRNDTARSVVERPAPSVAAEPVPHFAVIDVETTGLSPRQDRVLELAIVRVDSRGTVIDEWSTRFDPEGPVGATHIHGITQADVTGKPLFRDFAPSLIPHVAQLPIAAHNARFDLAFLRAEFQRAGWDVPWLPAYCTLDASRRHLPSLDRRRLADCCWAAGVPLDNAHSALGDARATAGLLSYYLQGAGNGVLDSDLRSVPTEARTVVWPDGPSRAPFTVFPDAVGSARRARPSRIAPARPTQPPLLRQITDLSLLDAIDEGAPDGSIVYLETLLVALEDGEISDEEASDLADLIGIYNLTEADLAAAHRAFILALAHKAVDDGHVSHDERAELHALATTLDVPANTITDLIAHADAARATRMSAGLRPLPVGWAHGEPLRVGDKVVFTGCDDNQRARLERRAESLGVRVMGNVSRLTSMLITDGTMDGTKLAKAREVGTRIVDPDVFDTLLKHLQPAAQPRETRQPQGVVPTEALPARPRPNNAGAPSGDGSPGAVRAWALSNGYPVGVRGRIAAEITAAYQRAHAPAAASA